MRNVKNITVAVSAGLYRQTRKLAAEYDTTVTAMVAHLLQRLPEALERTQFPVCGPKRARASRPNSLTTLIAASPDSANPSSVSAPTPSPNISCETVRPDLSHFLSMISDPILRTHAAAVFQY